jgi:pyruvate/2-oxoglutarate dehydrogenase complex dihydrolipoamide dehydrogenase (E3) component
MPPACPSPAPGLGLTYEDIPSLASLPGRVAVVGGADTGCQIASIFEDFGAAVTVFEAGPVLVPAADLSVSAELSRAFTAQGMTVATDTLVEALDRADEGITIRYRNGARKGRRVADAVFFAVGWPANLSQLNLDAAGVRAEPAAIPVDDYLRTNVEHIFAAGDVNGHSMLVQTARMEGRIAARNAILGPARQATYDVVPSGSLYQPQPGDVDLLANMGLAAFHLGDDTVVQRNLTWLRDFGRESAAVSLVVFAQARLPMADVPAGR